MDENDFLRDVTTDEEEGIDDDMIVTVLPPNDEPQVQRRGVRSSQSEEDDTSMKNDELEVTEEEENIEDQSNQNAKERSSSKPSVKEQKDNVATPDKSWKDYVTNPVDIQPYQCQLQPKGLLQSSIGFLPVYTNNLAKHDNQPSVRDPAGQILNLMDSKIQELSELRRFRMENFDSGPGLRLGRGEFHEIRRKDFEGRPVAVKRFLNYSNPLAIFKEVHTLIHLQNQRIVKLYGAFHEHGVTHIVTEPYVGTLLQNLKNLSAQQVVRFSLQLLEGLEFVHSRSILHCNINPSSCFITEKNNIVLGEFQYAELVPKGKEFLTTPANGTLIGNPPYNDPLANRGYYCNLNDVFGLGCTIFEMKTSEPLMMYKTWKEAPVCEYINVAEKGRLVKVPPVSKANKAGKTFWILDGAREPFEDRVKSCKVFGALVWDMVTELEDRLSPREVLDKYKLLIDKRLQKDDTKLGNVQPYVQNFPPVRVLSNSNQLDDMMDMIYYDANLDLGKVQSSLVTESRKKFSAISLDDLENAMKEVYDKFAVKVVECEATPEPGPSKSNSKKPIEELSSAIYKEVLKNASIKIIGEPKPISDKNKDGNVTEKPILPPKSTTASKGSEVKPRRRKPKAVDPPRDVSPELPALPKDMTARFTVTHRNGVPLSSRTYIPVKSPTPEADSSTQNPNSKPTKPLLKTGCTKSGSASKKVPAEEKLEVEPTKKGQKRKPPAVLEPKPEVQKGKRTSAQHSSAVKKPREEKLVEGGTKFCPVDQRGEPAPPKNIPEHLHYMYDPVTWRGWFDCRHCRSFWNVDYGLVEKHKKECRKKSNAKGKAT